MQDDKRAPNQSSSFRRDEIEVACAMFTKLSTGGDIAILQRSAAAQRLHRKFLGLRERARQEQILGPDQAESGA